MTSLDALVVHICPCNVHPLLCVYPAVFGNTSAVGTLAYVNAHVELALGTLLAGNEDYTVGSAVTVKCSRSGILKDGNALDIGGVEVGNVSGERNTVKYVQRACVTVDGSETTDTN